MTGFWAGGLTLMFYGLVFGGIGLYRSSLSLDTLWKSHERALLRRGLRPERTPEWERLELTQPRYAIVTGVVFLAVGFVLVLMAALSPQPLSQYGQIAGASFNNHRLTAQELDSCNHDFSTCSIMYGSRSGAR